jgi:ADP-heptose:LPS heptosyltransferase
VHILTIASPVHLADNDIVPAGTFVMDDIASAQFLMIANGGTMEPLTERRNPDFAGSGAQLMLQPRDGIVDVCDTLLVSRLGGIGDLVLLTPILREIKRRWPSVKLHVTCIKEYGQALQHLPFVDEIISSPISKEAMDAYDGWLLLENVIERDPSNETKNSVDLVADHIGLDMSKADKRQEYRVTMRENIWAEEAFPRKAGVRRICIQVAASNRSRTYPQALLGEIVAKLLKNGWEVMLMGKPGELKLPDKKPDNLWLLTDGFTFRQRCAVIATADCVLAPDSSLTHIAGALEIPCVALYSVFRWQQRTKYAPTTVGVNGVGPCAPCQHHPSLGKDFPENCPSRARGFCEVLAGIKPERIVALIETNAKGFKLQVVEAEADRNSHEEP